MSLQWCRTNLPGFTIGVAALFQVRCGAAVCGGYIREVPAGIVPTSKMDVCEHQVFSQSRLLFPGQFHFCPV